MRFHKPKLINIISYVLFGVSALILGLVITATMRVDVLRDWTIRLPDGDIHVGDTVVIQSTYTKVRDVTGIAKRYLDCENAAGSTIRYPINEARADWAPGSRTGTGVVIVIPNTIPGLPTKCRISVNVSYKVYPWRTVTEFQSTKEFMLKPAVPHEDESSSATQTSQSPVVMLNQVAGSSSNDAPISQDVQSSSLQNSANPQQQPPAASPQPQPEPSLLQRLLNTVTNLL